MNLFGRPMKNRCATVSVTFLVAFLLALDGNAQSNAPLKCGPNDPPCQECKGEWIALRRTLRATA
jgi:hypothetical protein